MADKILDSTGLAHLVTKIKEGISEKSKVSVSETGTSTTSINYITVDGTEYKLPTGGSGGSDLPEYPTTDGNYSLMAKVVKGITTLVWSSISSVWQLPLQTNNQLTIYQGYTINQYNNQLEVL